MIIFLDDHAAIASYNIIIYMHLDSEQPYATLKSTTSSKTDEGSRTQTLLRGMHLGQQTVLQEHQSPLQTTNTGQGTQTNGLPPDGMDGAAEEQLGILSSTTYRRRLVWILYI